MFTYIESIVEDNGDRVVRSTDILNINTFWLDTWHRRITLTQFYNEEWRYYEDRPRVGAWATNAHSVIFSSREAPTNGTVESVRIYNRYLEIKLQDSNTWYRAHEFLFLDQDERPAQEPNRARRNLASALENEQAELGVEYTLQDFQDKLAPKDTVTLRRWTYDEENKEWIMDEIDCDPATLGQTGSLIMPVKIKVKENGKLKWETTGNNKLVLYCAQFLKRWVGVENHTQSPNGNFREIVAVQYLTRDEVRTIQLQEERVSKNTRGQKRQRKELEERQKLSEKRQNDANYTRSASTLAAAGGETFAQRINNMRKKQLLRAEEELLTANHELDTMNLQRGNIPERARPTETEQFNIIEGQESAENARNELLTVLRSKDKEWVQKEWRGSPPSQRADLWMQWTQSQLQTLEEELDFITNKPEVKKKATAIDAEITKINTILDDKENPLEQSARDELEDKKESLQHRYNYLRLVFNGPESEEKRLAHQMKELKTMLSIQEKLKKRALAVKPEPAGAGMQSTSETKPFTLRIVVDDNLSLEATSLIFAMIEDTTVVQSEYKVEIAGYAEYMVREIILRFHLPSVRDRVGVFQGYIDSIADRFLGEFDKYFERRKELKLTQLWEDIYVEGKLKKKVTLGCCKQEEESAGAGGSATSTALTEMLRIGQLKF